MRLTFLTTACHLAACGWLALAGPGLEASPGSKPMVHGFMRVDPATRRRWTRHRQAALATSADPARGGTASPASTGGSPPSSFSLLPEVPNSTQRDQGACGSCWVWASTGMAEVALHSQYNLSDRLSVQYFQSGDTSQWACDGGDLTEFCNWYNSPTGNPHPNVLVPWSNPQGSYADASINAYQLASTVPPGAIGTVPGYAGVTLNHQTLATPSQSAAITAIENALLAGQAVGFSFWTNFLASDGFDAFWEEQPDSALWTNAYEGATENYPNPQWGGHMVMIVGWNASASPAYWILLNQWGTTSGRPDGCFRMPMLMNYDATYNLVQGSSSTAEPCYAFETLSLTTAGNLSPAGSATVPAGGFPASSGPAQFGQILTLEPGFTAGSPPFSYQWTVNHGSGAQVVAGATGAALNLPNDVVSNYGILDDSWQGATASVTVSNGAGHTTFGPFNLAVAGAVLNPDSGFQAGTSTAAWSWVDTTTVNPILAGGATFGGTYCAVLTGEGQSNGNAGTFSSAPVALPANPATPVLVTYYLEMATEEVNPLVLASCTLQVSDSAGHLLKVLKTHSNMDVDHLTFRPETFDITSLNTGGSEIMLQAVWSDPDGATSFRLGAAQILSGASGTGNPTLTGFAPASGAPGAAVTLTGTGFTGTTGVMFGRTHANDVSLAGPGEIIAIVPWDAASGPITVTGPAGTITSATPFYVAPSFISNTASYGYQFGSGLAEMAPTAGTMASTVRLLGLNFTGATGVTIGGVAAGFTVTSNTAINATVPVGAASGAIVVTTPGGTATSQGSFTVQGAAPALTFSPASTTAGSMVTLTGAGFTTARSVSFNGIAATAFAILSDTSLTAQVPSGLSSGPITVVTAAGAMVSAASFKVLAPFITGTPTGTVGAAMAVAGSGFLDVTRVTFNGAAISSFSVSSNLALTFTVPFLAKAGSYPLTVTSPEGTSLTAACVIGIPVVPASTSFTPSYGPLGTVVTVTGQYLTGTTAVTLGGVAAPFLVLSDSQLTFTVPSTAASGVVAVTTGSGTWTSTAIFHVNLAVTIPNSPDGLIEGGTFPFKVSVQGDPTNSVTWTVVEGLMGGKVDSSGSYTAPASAGTYHVMATSVMDATASAIATVPVHSAAISTVATTQACVIDLATLMAAYGTKAGDPAFNVLADFNGDGVINDSDLALFLAAF
jgi:hypothetical protein